MKTILAASDLGARSDRAVLRAAHIARDLGAALCIAHIVDDDLPGAVLQSRTEEAEAILSKMVSESVVLSDLAPVTKVEVGHVDRLLPEVVRDVGADLLVLGGHRNRGVGEVFGRPTLARLLRGATVPVLIAMGRPEEPYATASVGWDFSPAGEAAAKLALAIAPEADVTLIHAWQEICSGAPYAFETGGTIPSDVLTSLEGKLARAGAELSPPQTRALATEVVIGPAGAMMRQRCQHGQADLLALGRHARTGLARLILGATAEDVALYSSCDVLIAPPV